MLVMVVNLREYFEKYQRMLMIEDLKIDEEKID